MTARIVDQGTSIDADARTYADRVRLDAPMAEHLGRPESAPSRVHLGILWGVDGDDTAEYDFLYERGQRRRHTIGLGFPFSKGGGLASRSAADVQN